MLGERPIAPFGELLRPQTLGESVSTAIKRPLIQAAAAGAYIFPGLSSEKTRYDLSDKLEVMDRNLRDPRLGFGQKAANFVSELAGSLVTPQSLLAYGGARAVGGVASAIGFGGRKLAFQTGSEAIDTALIASQVPLSKLATGPLSHWLPNKSLPGIVTNTAKAYAAYKGYVIPEHIVENYHKENDTLDLNHAIKEWSHDNYGFLLGAAPLAAGYVLNKGIRAIINKRKSTLNNRAIDAEISRLFKEHDESLKKNEIKEGVYAGQIAKVSELQNHLHQAVEEGHITEKEHDWYLDFLENPHDMTKVHQGGLDIISDLQIPYDRVSGRVWTQLIDRTSMKNLNNAVTDQISTNFEASEKQALSSYIFHNSIDINVGILRENPKWNEAIKGMTYYLGTKLANKNKALQSFDAILDKSLPQGLGKKELFSQQNIYKHLKKMGVKDARDVPYTVPEAVIKRLKLSHKLDNIVSGKSAKFKKWFAEGLHTRIKDELKAIKLPTPKEELSHLRNQLIPNGKLVSNYKNKKSYHRLQELSQLWSNAKHLLDRVEMEAMYGKQTAFNEILKRFTEMVDSNVASFANPDHVKRYIHQRIERAVPFVREFERAGIDLKTVTAEVAENHKIVLEESKPIIEKTKFKEAKNLFEEHEKRFEQFASNQTALDELIKCQLGVA